MSIGRRLTGRLAGKVESPPGTSAVVDVTVQGPGIPEGAYVDVSVYDDAERSDLIGAARGTCAAIA